jgi:hypothetical protein
MRFRLILIALALSCLLQAQNKGPEDAGQHPNPAASVPEAPPFAACPVGAPLGAVDLQVEAGNQRLPFRTINHLTEGDTVHYAPVLRGKEKRTGEVALVLVPEKRGPGQEDILVTDPKPADEPQEWKMHQTISLAALVYAPSGLNRKRVAKFLSQDEVLIAQLADYADKTAQAQQLVATLSNSESSAASMNAALNGFAAQYGFAVQIDRSAPITAQASTVFAAMNPQLAVYNPLASKTAQSVGQTAGLATMAGTLFFGSPVGLAAGGTAMLLDLRAIAFPDTQFRASFAQVLVGSNSGLNLCGQLGPLPPHTRVAYIWASRIPNVSPPSIHIGNANFIPVGEKTPVPVDVPDPAWKYLDRAREWALVSNQGKKSPISVVKLANQRSLEVDLTKAKLAPGEYTLNGLWDWTPLKAAGTVHVLALDDFKTAHLDPASQDRLVAGSGKAPVTLWSTDFEFTIQVELQKLHDEFATPETIGFLLPKGLREGPQDHMDVQISTEGLTVGSYELLISQQDGKKHPVQFKVLPNPPKIDNLPVLLNQGIAVQHFMLKGERLGLITKLEASGADFKLDPAAENQTERSLTVELKSSPQPGTALAVKAYVQDRSEPVTLAGAVQITGPLPVIASSKLSLPSGMQISLHPDELPAGYTLNAMLDVRNIARSGVLRLSCAEGSGEQASLHIGEQTTHSSLQSLSPDQLFLAFDSSALPAGCLLQAAIDNGRGGSSQPFTLAHILRTPQIDSLTVSAAQPQNGMRQYQLIGQNLEMIQKLGWDQASLVDVSNLPTPLPGPGLKQSVEVNLPDPANPEAVLLVWLRGDKQARESTVKTPAMPPSPPAQQPASAAVTPGNSTEPTDQAAPPTAQQPQPKKKQDQ